MKKNFFSAVTFKNAIALAALAAISTTLVADDWHFDGGRPDGHAPIGVMGEHTHNKGEFMASYRYMNMFMSGNRKGNDRLSVGDVQNEGFPIVPTEMTMEMHMFGLMYAPVDRVTLMAMIPYTRLSMDHIFPAGQFTTKADGLGDVKVGALTRLWSGGIHSTHLNTMFGLPTGSIDRTGATPAGANSPLPYPMQLGSGTLDAMPGITYLGQTENWSWGAQVGGVFRLGKNDNGYSKGDQLDATSWLARRLCKWSSLSFRLDSNTWGNYDGRDNRAGFPPAGAVPTADPNRRGGTRLDGLVGMNFLAPSDSKLKGHRLAIEGGVPLYQQLEGPQLETDWIITVGWQFSW